MANVDYDGRYAQEQANLQNNCQFGLAGAQMGQIGHAHSVCDPGHSHAIGIYDPGHCHGIMQAPPMMHPDEFNRVYGGSDRQFMEEMQTREKAFHDKLRASQEAEFRKMAKDIMTTKQLPKAAAPWMPIGDGRKNSNPLANDPNAGMILRDGAAAPMPVLMKAKVPLAVKQVKKAFASMVVSDGNPSARYQAWTKE